MSAATRCDRCPYEAKSGAGLAIHKSKAHGVKAGDRASSTPPSTTPDVAELGARIDAGFERIRADREAGGFLPGEPLLGLKPSPPAELDDPELTFDEPLTFTVAEWRTAEAAAYVDGLPGGRAWIEHVLTDLLEVTAQRESVKRALEVPRRLGFELELIR